MGVIPGHFIGEDLKESFRDKSAECWHLKISHKVEDSERGTL